MKAGMWMTSMFGFGLGFVSVSCSISTDSFDCEDFCQRVDECPDATAHDCDAYCQSAESVNDSAHCGIEWDALMDCMANHESAICDGGACSSEVQEWGACVFVYCLTHLDDAEPVCTSDMF